MNEIYSPDEDSFLLLEILNKKIPESKNKEKLKILEIGSGSGIQLEQLENLGIKKQNIYCCDINEKAVKHCIKKNFNCVKSNLFSNLPKNWSKFDFVIFNPPYLPKDKNEPKTSELSTTGGKKGSEIINKFLKNADNYLKKGGKIFLVTSSLTKNIQWFGWKRKKIAEKKLFFERLFVWELKK